MKTKEERLQELPKLIKAKAEHILEIYSRMNKMVWELKDLDEKQYDEYEEHLDSWPNGDFDEMLNRLVTKIDKNIKKATE